MKLVVDTLSLSRAGLSVIREFSTELGAGEVMIVTGENGTGKSTLLRGIAGLLQPESGSVKLFDETGKSFEGPPREYMHYLGHRNAMKATLSVQENLAFWQAFCGHPHYSVEEALEEVGLSHTADLPFHYLSAGQKRRVAFCRLLVSDRPVWILDEPTTGLDKASVARFSTLCRAYCDEGGIIIAATHLPLGIKGARKVELKEAAPS